MDEVITLLKVTSVGDSFNRVTDEEKNTVFCEENSVSRREFFEASGRGIKAELMVVVWAIDYNGENYAEYGQDADGNPKRYRIYRDYSQKDSEKIELYLADEG